MSKLLDMKFLKWRKWMFCSQILPNWLPKMLSAHPSSLCFTCTTRRVSSQLWTPWLSVWANTQNNRAEMKLRSKMSTPRYAQRTMVNIWIRLHQEAWMAKRLALQWRRRFASSWNAEIYRTFLNPRPPWKAPLLTTTSYSSSIPCTHCPHKGNSWVFLSQ